MFLSTFFQLLLSLLIKNKYKIKSFYSFNHFHALKSVKTKIKMMTQFLGNLFGPVEMGHVFVIVGKTVDAPTSFEVNLCNGKSADSDLPFHMLIQFHREFIIRNSLIGGQWGENEIEENLSGLMVQNPIIPGWEFKIYIMVGVDSFHIAINNREFCSYKFRTTLEDIHAITILGDIHWLRQVDHRAAFPLPRPAIQYDDDTCAFSADVPRLFSPGHVVVITAIPYGNPNGTFIIKFTEGATYKQGFHLSARFQQKVVVVNSMKDNLE